MSELLQSLGAACLWTLVFLLLVANFKRNEDYNNSWVSSVLGGYPVFVLFQTLFVKGLDIFHILSTPYCVAGYLVVVVLGLTFAYFRGGYLAGKNLFAGPYDENDFLVKRIAFLCISLLVGGVIFYSLIVPVHIWDVQAYHMPMVASYVQNGTLAGWTTQDLRQIYRVNAGELQMLNVALLAKSDAWMELPNILALVVSIIAVLGIAKMLFEGPGIYFPAVLMLTAPQILLGSTTAKNDLIFLAAILCSFYWLIRLLQRTSPSTSDAVSIGLLALSGSLAAATKVMGLNVLASIALVLVICMVAKKISVRTLGWFCLFVPVTLFLFVGDIYWNNFLRSRMPVGILPDEVRFAIGFSTVFEAAKYYLYEISFRRLVAVQYPEHDISHYGYLFPIILGLGSLSIVRRLNRTMFQDMGLAALCLITVILMFSIISIRKPIVYDQRFMTWMIPAFSLLALSCFRAWPRNGWLVAVSFAGAFSIHNLFAVYTNSAHGIFARSLSYLIRHQELPRLVHVAAGEHAEKLQGFETVERQARASDFVLYVGGEDTWMYPSWGARFTRQVRGVRDSKDLIEKMQSGRFRFVVVENQAADDLKTTAARSAAHHGYFEIANGRERRVFRRDVDVPSIFLRSGLALRQ